jgi:hypothetical protein
MEDGIERSMSFLITDLEKKQRIVLMPKYEEQVHPIGLSLTGGTETTPISRTETTPIGRQTTPIGKHDNTQIGRQETIDKTLAKTTPNLQSTNTGSDS